MNQESVTSESQFPPPAAEEHRTIAEQVMSEVRRNGFCHLQQKLDIESFKEITMLLGDPVGQDEIRLGVTKRKLHSTGPLEMHTDSFIADLIAWHCVEPGSQPAPTVIVDTTDLPEHFSSSELEALSRVTMKCPNRSHDQFMLKPLISFEEARWKIFYTPWWLIEPDDPRAQDAYSKFCEYVKHKRANESRHQTLGKSESFFIDNKRMLHGRDALPPSSNRFLMRVWIARQPVDNMLVS